MTRADLLVLGGGPAGAMTALLAARRGARVVLLEKDTFPRDKVCGEFLSAEGCAAVRRHTKVLDEALAMGARPMSSCLLADAKGRWVASPLPEPALGISRRTLDALLLRAAAEAGVEVREETQAVAPVLERGRVTGVAAKRARGGQATETCAATLVVAADGRRSMLQRALHPGIGDPMTTAPSSWFGFQTRFADRTEGLGGRIELFVFDGGYAGLGPVDGGQLDLSFIARVDALRACGNTPDGLLSERLFRNPLLAERLGGAARTSPWHAVGPLRFGARRPASHGALFVGDAAGTIDPFSGEGMSNALVAAERAQPFVADAIARGGLSDAAAEAWTSTWRGAFVPVTRRARVIGGLFRHPRPAALAVRLLQLPAGARVLPSLVAASRTGTA